MWGDSVDQKVIVGLVGFRCCGKSTLRTILGNSGYPVFDSNSIRTGDADANAISLDEVLLRYGNNESYLLFLESSLKGFVSTNRGLIFIDSLKVSSDLGIMERMFPDCPIDLWYLHASYKTRLSRYVDRDINANIRSQKLEEHDKALETRGIWSLIEHATEAINMDMEIAEVEECIRQAIKRLRKKYP